MEEESRQCNVLLKAIYDSNNTENPISEILQSISKLPDRFDEIKVSVNEIQAEIDAIDLKPAQEEVEKLPIHALHQAQAVCLDLVVATEICEKCEETVFNKDHLEASRLLNTLSVDFSPVPESEVCKKLQAEIAEKHSELKEELAHKLQSLLRIKRKGIKLDHESSVKTVKGRTFVETDIKSLTAEILEVCQKEDQSKFIQTTTKSVFNVLKSVIQAPTFRSIQFSISKSMVSLSFSTDNALPFDIFVAIDIIVTILRFFKTYVFGDNDVFYLEFFEGFWERFEIEIVKESILEFHMPQTPAEAQLFLNKCESIETILRAKMEKFELCPIEIDWKFLQRFLEGFEDLFLDRFRMRTLDRVRGIIIDTDFSEFDQASIEEEESLFSSHSKQFFLGNRCKISDTMVSIIKIEYDLVAQLEDLQNGEEASNMSVAFRGLLRSMLREVFYLWQSTIQCHRIIGSDPEVTFLFYNDCQFFRHHLAMLTFYLKYTLKDDEAMLADLIAMLKAFGEKHFIYQLEQQYEQIEEEIAEISLDYVKRYVNESNIKVQSAMNMLHRFLNVVRGHLPDRTCYPILGNLLDVIALHFVEAVFSRVQAVDKSKEIGMNLAEDVCGLIHIIANHDKFRQDMLSHSYIKKHSKHTERLERIGEILQQDMNLARLEKLVLDRAFICFTWGEMQDLVSALWDQNPKRQKFFDACQEHLDCFACDDSKRSSTKPDP